jgi:hypothetical protein
MAARRGREADSGDRGGAMTKRIDPADYFDHPERAIALLNEVMSSDGNLDAIQRGVIHRRGGAGARRVQRAEADGGRARERHRLTLAGGITPSSAPSLNWYSAYQPSSRRHRLPCINGNSVREPQHR